MFISCLHCRELVATDRETGLPPAQCPRCGGVLLEAGEEAADGMTAATGAVRSFATFLRAGEAVGTANPGTENPEDVAATIETPHGEGHAGATAAESERELAPVDDDTPAILADTIEDADRASPVPAVALASAPRQEVASPAELPSFTRSGASSLSRPGTAKWQWAALFVLASLLGMQVLVADRARLAADAGWRPAILAICNALQCSVPAWHQPGAITMLKRDVRPLAGSSNGLNVEATFRNDARWPQRWPLLLLSLSDADGRVVGSRAFTPQEYLGGASTQTELAPGQSAHVSLELHEPNHDVVAFSFDFR